MRALFALARKMVLEPASLSRPDEPAMPAERWLDFGPPVLVDALEHSL